jgi:O-antigen/teichoic acid export membrane protein
MGTALLQVPLVLSFVVFARYLAIEDFSVLRQLSLLNLMIYTIAVAGLMPSLMYFKGRSSSDSSTHPKLAVKHLSIVIVLTVLMCVLVLIAKDGLAAVFGNDRVADLWAIYSVYPVLYAIYNSIPLILLSLDAPRYIRFYCPVASLLAAVPIYVATNNPGLEELIFWMVGSTAASIVIGSALVVKAGVTMRAAPTEITYREISKYAGYFYLAAVVSIIGSKLDHLLVSSLLGTVQYAIYVVGAFQIPIYSLVQSSVNSVAMSQMVVLLEERRWVEFKSLWQSCVMKVGMICIPIATFFAAFSSYFIMLVFGDQYSDSATVFTVFSLLAPIKCVSFGLILRSLGRPQYDLWGAILFLVITALSVPIGIWLLGGTGAAVAIAVSTFVLVGFMILMIKRESGGELRVFDVIPVRFITLLLQWSSVMVALRIGIDLVIG